MEDFMLQALFKDEIVSKHLDIRDITCLGSTCQTLNGVLRQDMGCNDKRGLRKLAFILIDAIAHIRANKVDYGFPHEDVTLNLNVYPYQKVSILIHADKGDVYPVHMTVTNINGVVYDQELSKNIAINSNDLFKIMYKHMHMRSNEVMWLCDADKKIPYIDVIVRYADMIETRGNNTMIKNMNKYNIPVFVDVESMRSFF